MITQQDIKKLLDDQLISQALVCPESEENAIVLAKLFQPRHQKILIEHDGCAENMGNILDTIRLNKQCGTVVYCPFLFWGYEDTKTKQIHLEHCFADIDGFMDEIKECLVQKVPCIYDCCSFAHIQDKFDELLLESKKYLADNDNKRKRVIIVGHTHPDLSPLGLEKPFASGVNFSMKDIMGLVEVTESIAKTGHPVKYAEMVINSFFDTNIISYDVKCKRLCKNVEPALQLKSGDYIRSKCFKGEDYCLSTYKKHKNSERTL